ncbi:ornithine carbamoyltransferase [Klebsiella quasipneumoniae]|nr:ornithine carbamoyltransferase [Klebsiella quasipneumoniae]
MSVYNIAQETLSKPYEYGVNDCNILALRVLDHIAGTEWSTIAKYKSIRTGYNLLKKLGYENTIDIIKEYADEVTHGIDGDIWVNDNDKMSLALVMSHRLVCVNDSHTGFELRQMNKQGTYYRIRK